MSDNKKSMMGGVEIFIPRGSDRDDPNHFIGINGVNYLLPKGKSSVVPQHVAAEYKRSLAAEDAMHRNAQTMSGGK